MDLACLSVGEPYCALFVHKCVCTLIGTDLSDWKLDLSAWGCKGSTCALPWLPWRV